MARLSERRLSGLLKARNNLAEFLKASEREARTAGTTHAQHHVLLHIEQLHIDQRHLDPRQGDADPTIKDVAAALGVASPSVVELISRMVAADSATG